MPSWADVKIFALAATPQDAITRRFKTLPNEWMEVATMDDAALNHAIRAQKIDVLIELHGHTGGNRLVALADKPAPVIITALGYLNTTAGYRLARGGFHHQSTGDGSA